HTSSQSVADKCALAAIHASFRLSGDAENALAQLRRFSADQRRSLDTRIEAAELGLGVAGLNGAADDSHALFTTVAPLLRLNGDQGASLACSVVYNTSYGDLDVALADAIAFVKTTENIADQAMICRSLRFRATVLERLGMHDAAQDDLLRCLQLNESIRSRFVNTVTLVRLLQLALDAGWDEQATQYFRELYPPESAPEDPVTGAGYTVLRARHLLTTGDAQSAWNLLANGAQASLVQQPLRHVAEYHAVMGLTALALGDQGVPRQALKELSDCRAGLWQSGGFDFSAAAHSVLSCAHEGPDVGQNNWNDYMRVRRERGTPAPGILRVLASAALA